MNCSNFFYVFENTVFGKKIDQRAIVNSIFRKIPVCDMHICYKNISKFRNVTFIFQNCQKLFQNVRKKLESFICILKEQ